LSRSSRIRPATAMRRTGADPPGAPPLPGSLRALCDTARDRTSSLTVSRSGAAIPKAAGWRTPPGGGKTMRPCKDSGP